MIRSCFSKKILLLLCFSVSAVFIYSQEEQLENAVRIGYKNDDKEYVASFKNLKYDKKRKIEEWCRKNGYVVTDIRTFEKERFGGSVKRFINYVKFQTMEQRAYKVAKEEKTAGAVNYYLRKYPTGPNAREVISFLANVTKTIEENSEYAIKYPEMSEIFALKAYRLSTIGTSESRELFLRSFPNSEYAQNVINDFCKYSKSTTECIKYIERFPESTVCFDNKILSLLEHSKNYKDYTPYLNNRYISENHDLIVSSFLTALKDVKTCHLAQKEVNGYKVEITNRAYDLAIELKNPSDFISYFPNNDYTPELKKLRDDILIEKKRKEEEVQRKEEEAVLKKRKEQDKLAALKKAKTEKHMAQIVANSDRSRWQLGDFLCSKPPHHIRGILDEFNSDRSKVKLKILGGPNIVFEGQQLYKEEYVWVASDRWYECIGDESIDYSLVRKNEQNSVVQTNPNDNILLDKIVSDYAWKLANEIMWEVHVEENPRDLNVLIQNWEPVLSAKGETTYTVDCTVTWVENPIFAQTREIKGIMGFDEYGCQAFMIIDEHTIPYLIFNPFTKMDPNETATLKNNYGRTFNRAYIGSCVK